MMEQVVHYKYTLKQSSQFKKGFPFRLSIHSKLFDKQKKR